MKHITGKGQIIEISDMVTPHLVNCLKKILREGVKTKWIHLRPIASIMPLIVLYADHLETYCDPEILEVKKEFTYRNRESEYKRIIKDFEKELSISFAYCQEAFYERVLDVVIENNETYVQMEIDQMTRERQNEFIINKVNLLKEKLK